MLAKYLKEFCTPEDVSITSEYSAQESNECGLETRNFGEIQSSAHTETDNTSDDVTAQQQIVFHDANLSQRITFGDLEDDTFHHDTENTASLANFLERPVKISSFTWDLNNLSFTTPNIQPWSLYFNHPSIKRKLQNYSRLHAKLHLKYVINATPFYYGSLRVVYQPLPDQRLDQVQDNDKVPLSQMPGFYLEPQNMSTSEMELPFVWPSTWLNTRKKSDFDRMGEITYVQYAKLRSANGVGSAGVTVAVFAWASEVELAGPTYDGVLQSSEYEESNAVISGPATAIANIASRLTDVPVIGTMAMATTIGARAVAGIAKLFGYSNPPIIDDVKPFKQTTFHAFANVETRFPIDRLAIDPKNEVTISSKVAGITEDDPLAFCNLLTKESFVQVASYANSQPEDTLIWSALVSPNYKIDQSSGGGQYYTVTPVGYVSKMFRFWRGSLIYKFRIIKSKYHKGRLTISWDPNKNIIGDVDADSTCFTRIVDLETEDEVEIEIPYRATTPYLEVGLPNDSFSNGTSPVYLYNDTIYNGCLTVRVQNVLTGPAVSPELDILVYQRAGSDFTFAVPNEIPVDITTRDPAGVIQSSAVEEIAQKESSPDQHIAVLTTGEMIASLRPILHRTSLSCVQGLVTTAANTTGNVVVNTGLWRIPPGLGRSTEGYNLTSTNIPYNYVFNHPIDWVLEMFVGYRGSVNISANVRAKARGNVEVGNIAISRWFHNPLINSTNAQRNTVQSGGVSYLQGANLARMAIDVTNGVVNENSGQNGFSVTAPIGQPGLSVSIPQYSKLRFYTAFHSNRSIDVSTGEPFYDEAKLTVQLTSQGAPSPSSPWPCAHVFYSAGVDFQPLFFMCTPRIFSVGGLPLAGTIT